MDIHQYNPNPPLLIPPSDPIHISHIMDILCHCSIQIFIWQRNECPYEKSNRCNIHLAHIRLSIADILIDEDHMISPLFTIAPPIVCIIFHDSFWLHFALSTYNPRSGKAYPICLDINILSNLRQYFQKIKTVISDRKYICLGSLMLSNGSPVIYPNS